MRNNKWGCFRPLLLGVICYLAQIAKLESVPGSILWHNFQKHIVFKSRVPSISRKTTDAIISCLSCVPSRNQFPKISWQKHKEIYWLLISALFAIASNFKHLKYLSVGDWMNKLCSSHVMEHQATVKKDTEPPLNYCAEMCVWYVMLLIIFLMEG